jgi:hypothetical protein
MAEVTGLSVVGPFTVHHHYYHIDGKTDIKPTRDQAEARRKDKRHPESSCIHMHAKETGCSGKSHEIRNAGSNTVVEFTPS